VRYDSEVGATDAFLLADDDDADDVACPIGAFRFTEDDAEEEIVAEFLVFH
jgi:hypothetical protein